VLPSADEVERAAWDDAVKVNTVAAYEAYLKGYAQGRFAHRARVRIATLPPPPSAESHASPTAESAVPGTASAVGANPARKRVGKHDSAASQGTDTGPAEQSPFVVK
jgi:hypothetical protein